MADQFAVVTFTTPASPTTLDITSPDITETFSAAILIFSRETTDSANNAHGILGVGFIGVNGTQGESSLQCAISCSLENGLAAGQDCDTSRSVTTCIRASDGTASGSLDIVAAYSASISGGVRLNFTTADVQAKCTAILFAGLSKAATGDCTFDEAGSHEDTGAGGDLFQPDVVIFRSSDNVLTADTPNGTLALGFAVRRSPIQQVSAYVNWDDRADPTDSDGFLRSDCASGNFIGDRVVAMDRFQVTSFDSTGFNGIAIDTGDANSPQANYLALKFSSAVRLACGNYAISGSTGNQDFSSVGFPARLVFGMSTLMGSVDTLIDGATASAAGYFVTGEYGERAYTVHNEENLNIGGAVVSSAHTRQEDVGLLTYEHTGTVAQRATWVQSLSGGFRLSFSTATAGYMTALAIGFFEVDGETIQISDGAVFDVEVSKLEGDLEVVQISEGYASDVETDPALTAQLPLGSTYQAGAQRARTVQAGAVQARTL